MLLMMESRTADPKAPPMALAENASPVAVERYAWGDVNCTRATRRVSGPLWPIPANPVQLMTMTYLDIKLTENIENDLSMVHTRLDICITYCAEGC